MSSPAAARNAKRRKFNRQPRTLLRSNSAPLGRNTLDLFRKAFLNERSALQEPQVTRYKDHFSLQTPTSTVRFQDSKSAARVICNQGSQLVLEETYDEERKKRQITIKRMKEEASGALRFLRAVYVLFSAFMTGFLFVLSLQIIFFVILDLVITLGQTSLQKAQYHYAVGVVLSLPLLIHSMASAMMLAGTFLVDNWKGHYLFNKFVFPGLQDYLVEWIFFLGFLALPLVVMCSYLIARNEHWWEYTALYWFLSVFFFFIVFTLNILWYEARVFLRVVRDSDMIEDYGSMWGRIYACITMRQRHSLSGYSYTKYSSFGSPEGAITMDASSEPNSRKYIVDETLKENQRGLYTRFTQWSLLQNMCKLYEKLEQPKRLLSIEEVVQRRPYVTNYTWSLERYFCRRGKSRYIGIVEGPGALTRAQIVSSFICSLVGLCIVCLILAALLVYYGSGGKIAIGFSICVAVISLPAVLKPFTLYLYLKNHKRVKCEAKEVKEASVREKVNNGNSKHICTDGGDEVSETQNDDKQEEQQGGASTDDHRKSASSCRGQRLASGQGSMDSSGQTELNEIKSSSDLKAGTSLTLSTPTPSVGSPGLSGLAPLQATLPEDDLEWAGFAKDHSETSLGVYFVTEAYRVTQPTHLFGTAIFVVEALLLVIWPTVSLYAIESIQLSTLYLGVAVLSSIRYFTDAEVLLEEIGGLSRLPNRNDEAKNWRTQSRLSEVTATVGKGNSYYGWRMFYSLFTILFLAVGGLAVGATVESRADEEYTFLPSFHYDKQDSVQYVACSFDGNYHQGLPETNIADYAFLAIQAYRVENETREDLVDWFGPGKVADLTEVADRFRESDELEVSTAAYYKLFSIETNSGSSHAIVSIRGTSNAWDALADFQLWSAAIFLQAVRSALPFGVMYTPILHRVSNILSKLQSGTIERVSFHKSTTKFVQYLVDSGNYSSVAITGHSLGGGLAIISGAQAGVQAIGVSAPNAMISRKRFGITADAINRYTFNIIPDRDIVPMTDDPAKTIQRIECRAAKDDQLGCHAKLRSLCEIMYTCGSGPRPVLCECVSDFGYPEPLPNGNTTISFQEACAATNTTR